MDRMCSDGGSHQTHAGTSAVEAASHLQMSYYGRCHTGDVATQACQVLLRSQVGERDEGAHVRRQQRPQDARCHKHARRSTLVHGLSTHLSWEQCNNCYFLPRLQGGERGAGADAG